MPGSPIVDVKEVFTQGREAKTGSDWKREYKRVFQVTTISPTVGAATVRNSIGVSIGNPYDTTDGVGTVADEWTERDPGSYVNSIMAAQSGGDDGDGMNWFVTVSYGGYDPTVFPENPLHRPVTVDWDFAQFQRTVDEDETGTPVVNSAGDYFDPPVETDDSRPVLTLVRNEARFDPMLAMNYKDSTNSDLWFGIFPPRTAKCVNIKPKHILDPNIGWYWEVTYEFSFNFIDTWIRKILNQGMRQLSLDQTKYEHIMQKGGPITSPVPLDENGRELPAGTAPYFLEFHILKEQAFADFNFPPLPA